MANYNGLEGRSRGQKCNGLRGDQRKKKIKKENSEQEIWTGVQIMFSNYSPLTETEIY